MFCKHSFAFWEQFAKIFYKVLCALFALCGTLTVQHLTDFIIISQFLILVYEADFSSLLYPNVLQQTGNMFTS